MEADVSVKLPLQAPFINAKHIDGPLLVRPYGGLHWLTIRERIALRFGFLTAEALEAKLQAQEARRGQG
jgi:hypothetical protein